MCEGQERGISGVIRHSCVCGNPVLSLSTEVVLTGGTLGNAQVSCGHHDGHPCDEHAVARKAHLQDAPA
jgi:hypothetical protein